LNKDIWTSNSINTKDFKFKIYILKEFYEYLEEELITKNIEIIKVDKIDHNDYK